MPSPAPPSVKSVLAKLIVRLDPHFSEEGFIRDPTARPGEVRWTKRPDDAPGDELDRVALIVSSVRSPRAGCAIRGLAWSWTRTAPVNLRTLAIRHREPGAPPTPSGWLLTTPAAVDVVVAELETLVHGQLIGWLDEPVPLGGGDGSVLELPQASELLLSDLVLPSTQPRLSNSCGPNDWEAEVESEVFPGSVVEPRGSAEGSEAASGRDRPQSVTGAVFGQPQPSGAGPRDE